MSNPNIGRVLFREEIIWRRVQIMNILNIYSLNHSTKRVSDKVQLATPTKLFLNRNTKRTSEKAQ